MLKKYDLSNLKDLAIEASQSGIVITDFSKKDNPIIYINSGFENMTGYSKEETINRNCRFLQGVEKDQPGIEILRKAIKEGRNCQVVLRNYKKNGELFYNELFISPIKNENSEITNYIGIQTDVTKRVIAEESLKEKSKQLEQSNEDLKQFAAVISHDLQEPLRMVSTFMELLSEKYKDKLDEKANEYIYYAHDGATRMQLLINDILDYSRIKSKDELKKMVNLNKVLQEALINLQTQINEKQASIELCDLPTINGIAAQWVLVFQNLINNSIKYCTNKPKVKILYSIKEKNHIISIVDNGIGIDPHNYEYVFEIFKRLHSRKDYPGTGIGLAICKKVIESHNGTISIKSSQGNGSIFEIQLPI